MERWLSRYRDGETAQWVERLMHRYKSLSLDPSTHTKKKKNGRGCVPVSGDYDGNILGAFWLISVASFSAPGLLTLPEKKKKVQSERKILNFDLCPWHPHAWVCIHKNNTHTHLKSSMVIVPPLLFLLRIAFGYLGSFVVLALVCTGQKWVLVIFFYPSTTWLLRLDLSLNWENVH